MLLPLWSHPSREILLSENRHLAHTDSQFPSWHTLRKARRHRISFFRLDTRCMLACFSLTGSVIATSKSVFLFHVFQENDENVPEASGHSKLLKEGVREE